MPSSTIKKSKDKEEAHENLIKKFKLTPIQTTAILEMRLQTLAALESKKIEDELKEKMRIIKELQTLLASVTKILGVITNELRDLRDKFGDDRRTKVVPGAIGEFKEIDLILLRKYLAVLKENDFAKKTVARRMAESLLRMGNGQMTVADLLTRAEATPGLTPIGPVDGVDFGGGGAAAPAKAPAADKGPSGGNGAEAAVAAGGAPAAVAETEEESLSLEPWIETARCTSCNECTILNPRLFGYDANKQAFIKDVHAGTFAQLVQGAERCPAGIIHPGDPVNPKEKDLEKWIKRAEPFN